MIVTEPKVFIVHIFPDLKKLAAIFDKAVTPECVYAQMSCMSLKRAAVPRWLVGEIGIGDIPVCGMWEDMHRPTDRYLPTYAPWLDEDFIGRPIEFDIGNVEIRRVLLMEAALCIREQYL